MGKKYNLSIIIISYNVRGKLVHNYEQIIKFNIPKLEIIIIDNNSSDYSFEAVNQIKRANTKLTKNAVNLGFSKAVNQGISKAKGKYVLLINPDTESNKDAILKLLSKLKSDTKIGLVGGKMIKPKSGDVHGTYVNKPNFLIGLFEFTNLKKIFPNNKYSKKFYYFGEDPNKIRNVWGLSGGFLMFSKAIINKIGLLDENFFMYLEDVDLGIRARKMGFKVLYLPSAVIKHDAGSSSKNRYKINVKAWRDSRNYFYYKYLNKFQWILLRVCFVIDDFLVDLIHLARHDPLS